MDLEKLEKLHELKEKGILSAEEFDQKKAELLDENKIEKKEYTAKNDETDGSHLGIIKGSFYAFVLAFKRWNDFKGRTSRFDYWGAYVFLFIAYFIITIFITLCGSSPNFILIPLYWINIMLYIRRLHDVNMRGWWILTIIVPFIISFFQGDKKENRFGAAPVTDEKKAAFLVIGAFTFSVLIELGLGGYTEANKKYAIAKTTDQVQSIITNVRTLFSGQRFYSSLTSADAYMMGILSAEMFDESTKKAVNAYGGSILLGAPNDGRYFSITFNGLPRDVCAQLVTSNWGGASLGFVGLIVSSTEQAIPTNNTASSPTFATALGAFSVTPAEAMAACGRNSIGNSSSITWIYR